MTQQLRDAQQQTETIHSQLNDIQQHLNESERAQDHAELQLEVMQLSGANQASGQSHHQARPASHQPKKMLKSETRYPEGGGKTEWFTDGEDIDSSDSCEWCHKGYYV